MQSKIPRPYFFVESTEANEELTKLDAFDVTSKKISHSSTFIHIHEIQLR